MSPDSRSWIVKIRSALSPSSPKPFPSLGVLSFDAAALMSKLLQLWRSLSDPNLRSLRQRLSRPAIRKLVSDDPSLILSLTCLDLLDSLRSVVASIAPLSRRCSEPSLRQFPTLFDELFTHGLDPYSWSLSSKDMNSVAKKMERCIQSTRALYREMDELHEREQYLKRQLKYPASKVTASVITNLQQKIFWQQQEVKHLKYTSLWRRSFDFVASILARAAFSILARIRHVLPDNPAAASMPPPGTLGADALALRYANVIAVIERMVRSSPQAIGPEARDELYGLLPDGLRGRLRSRLRGVGGCVTMDSGLAADWKAALGSIVEWLGPAAHNTLRWEVERSFERRGREGGERAGILRVETLQFALRERVEEAVAEMLVGLNYVWRFEVDMIAKAKAAQAGTAFLFAEAGVGFSVINVQYFVPKPRLSFSERPLIQSPLRCR